MSKYLFLFAAIFMSAVAAHAQSESKNVSLENWDLGAVKVIVEPKPEPKSKAADKANAAAKKPGATDSKTEKTAAKNQTKDADKTVASTKETSAAVRVIDLNTSETLATSATDSHPKPVVTGRAELDKIIDSASKESGVDPRLIYSVMNQESGFHTNAVSPKGASGLMQLIPATARRFGVQDIFDPKQNVHAGAKYLRFLLDTFDGDVELALAGYNAGENAVIKYGYRVPPYSETQNYVRSIVARYGQKNLRPTDVTASIRLSTPIIIATSEKGVLLLSNNY